MRALILCLALTGCASTQDHFDPAFSQDEIEAIEAGFSEWPKYQGVEVIKIDASHAHPEAPDDPTLYGDTKRNTFVQPKIYLWTDRIAKAEAHGLQSALQRTAAHEMGHALGLQHAPNSVPSSIMKADIVDAAPEPTAYDLASIEDQ